MSIQEMKTALAALSELCNEFITHPLRTPEHGDDEVYAGSCARRERIRDDGRKAIGLLGRMIAEQEEKEQGRLRPDEDQLRVLGRSSDPLSSMKRIVDAESTGPWSTVWFKLYQDEHGSFWTVIRDNTTNQQLRCRLTIEQIRHLGNAIEAATAVKGSITTQPKNAEMLLIGANSDMSSGIVEWCTSWKDEEISGSPREYHARFIFDGPLVWLSLAHGKEGACRVVKVPFSKDQINSLYPWLARSVKACWGWDPLPKGFAWPDDNDSGSAADEADRYYTSRMPRLDTFDFFTATPPQDRSLNMQCLDTSADGEELIFETNVHITAGMAWIETGVTDSATGRVTSIKHKLARTQTGALAELLAGMGLLQQEAPHQGGASLDQLADMPMEQYREQRLLQRVAGLERTTKDHGNDLDGLREQMADIRLSVTEALDKAATRIGQVLLGRD